MTVGAPLSPLGALVFSVASFRRRDFFPGGSPSHNITLDDPLTVLAASEALLSLLIEISPSSEKRSRGGTSGQVMCVVYRPTPLLPLQERERVGYPPLVCFSCQPAVSDSLLKVNDHSSNRSLIENTAVWPLCGVVGDIHEFPQ